jgi:hypothetical protein
MPAGQRDLAVGAAAGMLAWLGMAGWALLGVSLAGFGAAATPAALALAVGGEVGVSQDVGPAQLTGSISVVPLGVSLVGAVVLAVALTTWQRVAGAAVAFGIGLVMLLFLPAGELAVRGWSTVLGGVVWFAVVVGLRVAMWWVPRVRAVITVLLGAAAVATVAGAVTAVAGGARVLGTMVLAAPNLLCVALTRGLGVPWEVLGPDLPLPTVDTGAWGPMAAPVWPLAAIAAVVVVLVAVVVGWHAPWVTAVGFAAMAGLGGAAVELRAGFFAIDIGVGGDVLVAAGVGLAAGAVASLIVGAGRYWHRRSA